MVIGPIQKRIRIGLWGLILLAMVGIVVGKILLPRYGQAEGQPGMRIASQAPEEHALTELFSVPEMKLTDQDDRPFLTSQLRGKPWVADFVFTTCGNICPMMSAKMAEIQGQTPAAVNLVSFTVDPEHDTPGVLKAYGQRLHADFSRWHFLTGSHAQMADAAFQMKISVRAADANSPILHSDKFLLVNADGNVVGVYNGTDDADVKQLIADATKLAGGERKPL
ncbi:MAG TPA: SCO family protein [Tepidisphaeraceae bacterium]|jgi:protein SCO1/2|nr:SCO family protein [Tepidisphaeraceae bacterium]